MASITYKQINDINSKCKNGFVLDIETYVAWKEKKLRKNIVVNEHVVIDVVIEFLHNYNRYSTGKVTVYPNINISIMTRRGTEGLYRITNVLHVHDDVEYPRRNMKYLYEIENRLTDKEILDKVNHEMLHEKRDKYDMIFGKEVVDAIENFIAA